MAINGTDAPIDIEDIEYSRLNLKKGYKVRLFEDGVSGKEDKWKISDADSLPTSFSLQPRGGIVIVIKPGPQASPRVGGNDMGRAETM